MERTKRAENANPFKWPRYGQDQHQFSSVILTRERNFRSTWCGNSAQTRFESKPWNQDRSGEGGEELVAVRIKSSHLIKLLWAGSLFPRRIGVSCNEIPRVPRRRFRSGEREREREKRFVANSHSFVCPDQFEEKLGYEFLLESKLILTFDELLYRGGVGIKIRTISHRHLHPFSEMNFIKDQVGYRWNPPSMFITCNLVYRKKMGKRKRIT